MNNYLVLGAVASALFSNIATAAEPAKTSNLDIAAELGVLLTTGNTDTSSFFTKVVATQKLDKWTNKYTFDMLKKEAEIKDADGNKMTQETDDRWNASAKGSRKFGAKSSAFVLGSYADTQYGAYATYATVSGGYSFRAIEKENLFLDLDVGAGFVDAKVQGTDESDDSELYRGSAALEWKINDMTKFVQNVSVEHAPGLDNTQTITETGVSASFSSSMQMKFGFKTISNTQVAEGFEKTDTETSVTVVVNF